jgi:hypothetical protein
MSSNALNLFPARVPIGLVQPDGTVLMTPEFVRAMRALFQRVGGPEGMASDDLAILAASVAQANSAQAQAIEDVAAVTSPDWSGQIAALIAEVGDLRSQANQFVQVQAELAEIRKALEGVEIQATYRDPFRVDWERPGKIGSLTANSGAFTTLTASQAVTLSPANANVVLSPTGTGVVTINPATAGAMDNVNIGATTAGTGKFTTVQSTGGAGFNGATPQTAVASGGALAAYSAGANGLDTAAHMQALHALVVSIRAALVANGIMS